MSNKASHMHVQRPLIADVSYEHIVHDKYVNVNMQFHDDNFNNSTSYISYSSNLSTSQFADAQKNPINTLHAFRNKSTLLRVQ